MSDKDFSSKYSRKGVLRNTDAAPSQSNSAMTPPIQSRFATNTKAERLKSKKKEIFHSDINNLGQLKNFLEKNFTWCQEFSDLEFLSKDEKISLFELTILVNQTIGHLSSLQDALNECKKSSEYWEDLFDTIAEHFDVYMQFYVQYLSSIDTMQETVKKLQEHDHMKSVFNDLSWLGKEQYEFERVLTYPRDRLRSLKSITEEARTILSNVSDGKTISGSDREELKGCERTLSNLTKILAADTSSKSEIVIPKRYRRCRVIYSLRPGQGDELRLKENDIIEIISKNRNGWWQGRLPNKKVGWFPGNYVEELDDSGSSGSTDSTEKAGSSDEDGNYHLQSPSNKTNKSSGSSAKHESDDTLARLQRQLSDADKDRATAEARVQELILEAQRAKAEAEARAEEIKKVLKSGKVEQRPRTHSTDSDESDPDSGDGDIEDGSDDYEEEDEYAADRAQMNNSLKELDDLASVATGSEPRTKTKKGADIDEYEDLECYFCKKVIQTYIPKEGKSYCPSCYDDLFTKKCFKCKKPITGTGLTYKEKPWHSDCFTCTLCDAPIAGEKFISREDKPYCADCFGENFAKRCTGCSKPIIGDNGMSFITSGGRSWHNECFMCTSCQESLIGRGFFFSKEDNIVCPGCG